MLVYFLLSRTGAPRWLSKGSGEAGDGSITWELVRNACSQTPRPRLPESGTLGQRAAFFFFFFFNLFIFSAFCFKMYHPADSEAQAGLRTTGQPHRVSGHLQRSPKGNGTPSQMLSGVAATFLG